MRFLTLAFHRLIFLDNFTIPNIPGKLIWVKLVGKMAIPEI